MYDFGAQPLANWAMNMIHENKKCNKKIIKEKNNTKPKYKIAFNATEVSSKYLTTTK